MKKQFKLLALLMALVTMLTCMTMPIQAAVVQPDVEPNWENTNNIILTLSFPDDGYAEASVVGQLGVTKIVIDIFVYRQIGSSWALVGEEHTTILDIGGIASCQFNSINRAYYRADYTITVTKDNYDEVINKTIYRTCSQ